MLEKAIQGNSKAGYSVYIVLRNPLHPSRHNLDHILFFLKGKRCAQGLSYLGVSSHYKVTFISFVIFSKKIQRLWIYDKYFSFCHRLLCAKSKHIEKTKVPFNCDIATCLTSYRSLNFNYD